MITAEPIEVAFVFFTIGVAILAYLIGGFVEWNKADGSQDLRRQLRDAQSETEDLREYIWLVTAGTSTTQSLMKEGALPTESVEVERSLRPNSGRASE